jgi:hypothetical protein
VSLEEVKSLSRLSESVFGVEFSRNLPMSKAIQLLVAAGVGAVAIGSAVYLLNRQSNLEKKKLRHRYLQQFL